MAYAAKVQAECEDEDEDEDLAPKHWLVLNFRKFISQSRRSVRCATTFCFVRKKGFTRVNPKHVA